MTGSTGVRDYDLLIFDMDGVLADSSGAHACAWADLWQRLGIQGPEYRSIAGQRTTDVIARYAAPLDPSRQQTAEWVGFKQQRARAYLEGMSAGFPDTAPSVRLLAAYGYGLAVGTGASRATATTLLASIGLLELFRTVVTAEDVSASKPSPETFLTALAHAGGDPDRTLIAEDSVQGLEAAVAAGAWVVSVRSGERLTHPRFAGAYQDLASLADALVPRAA